jgi:hypothetical protein
MYARHARALRLASPRRVRVQIFVSRRALEERLGSAADAPCDIYLAGAAVGRRNVGKDIIAQSAGL